MKTDTWYYVSLLMFLIAYQNDTISDISGKREHCFYFLNFFKRGY